VIILTVSFWLIAAAHGLGIAPSRMQAVQASTVTTAVFPAHGLILRISSRCESSSPRCPFQAEIDGPDAIVRSIQQVDYTFFPGRPRSPAPVTDAGTHFRLEATQNFGEKVFATVTLKSRPAGPSRTVLLEGTIPFAVEVQPRLPDGLRFEVKYEQQSLEGRATNDYYFRIVLRGEAGALRRIRSVNYRLPAGDSRSALRAYPETQYFMDGSAPNDGTRDIVAVIRWSDGTTSTHSIPFRPR